MECRGVRRCYKSVPSRGLKISDSEQFPRLKVHVFRRFNCLALNALGKISTCQISSQERNGLELIQLLISTIPTA